DSEAEDSSRSPQQARRLHLNFDRPDKRMQRLDRQAMELPQARESPSRKDGQFQWLRRRDARLPVCAFDASEANARTCMSTTTAPSSKQEKPTLAGVTVKTRKRNIVVPVDPGSFADAVVQIVQDASDGQSVAEDLEAAGKALDAAEIEYSRYGDTLFEVLFAGGRLANGAALAEGGARLPFNILGSPAERDAIAPYIKLFQNLTRRRPFLVRGIENTMVKLLLSLEFFNAENRKKIALALALIFSMKIAVLPDNIFGAMLNDRLVAKGTVQEVFTIFCQTFLAKDSMDDLVSILTKAKVANQLLDYMPPQKRSLQDFNEHFKSAGLEALVEWNMKRDQEIKISELQEALSNMITADEPASPAEVLSMVKSKKIENNLPERQVVLLLCEVLCEVLLLCACSEVLRVVWTSLMKAVNMGGKNQQQIMQAIVAKIKTYHKLLSTFATNGKLELGLLLVVQVQCYEDNRLLKLFSDIVRVLYDADIVGEDAIFHCCQAAGIAVIAASNGPCRPHCCLLDTAGTRKAATLRAAMCSLRTLSLSSSGWRRLRRRQTEAAADLGRLSTQLDHWIAKFRFGNINRTCTRCIVGLYDDASQFSSECTATRSMWRQPEFVVAICSKNNNLHAFVWSRCAQCT
ncbi:hypothetical protein QJQ45_023784, partial [Haematococcus lacustris]